MQIVAATGATIVHPYNNFQVIAGQGTAAKELIEAVGQLHIVMCPVGGGGLLSGTALSAKALLPGCKVVAAEPVGADDACRSFREGHIVPSVNPKTIADGLLTSLGEMNFPIIQQYVDDIVTVLKRLLWRQCDWYGNG
jgi:Threonine dehydratase